MTTLKLQTKDDFSNLQVLNVSFIENFCCFDKKKKDFLNP